MGMAAGKTVVSERWVPTYTGLKFHILDPRARDVRIEDIATQLSRIARFNGGTSLAYSVAQHSVHVAELCPSLAALLHDAAEAYIGDCVLPLKDELPRFRQIENKILDAVRIAFHLRPGAFDDPAIKLADETMLATEWRDIVAVKDIERELPAPVGWKVEPWPPIKAYLAFKARFRELNG